MDHPLAVSSADATAAEQTAEASLVAATVASTLTPQQQRQFLNSRGPTAPLDRDAIKAWVLRTYTADEGFPVISSVVTEVSNLSEDERARLRLQRLEVLASGTQITTSGGVVTAPVQQQQRQQQQQHSDPTASSPPPAPPPAAGATSPTSPNAPSSQPSAGGEEGGLVSQNEIVHMLETMDSELKRHWAAGDKVKALRLAIQATKMLSYAGKVPACFPSMFVLVATVLDSLGDRVADRLESVAVSHDPIIERLVAEGRDIPFVPPEAAELCGNWFHKILSIRELLCRVTVELALLKCFKYAGEKSRVPVKQVIVRLANQIRGVAQPQVASHLRWYLFMRAKDELSRGSSQKSATSWAHCLAQCAVDNLDMMSRMTLPATNKDVFLGTFQPSLRWMFDTIVRYGGNAATPFLDEALRLIEESPQLQYGSVAGVFMQCAPPEYLFKNFERVWSALVDNEGIVFTPQYSKLRAVAELLAAMADPSSGVGRLSKSKRAQMLNILFGAVAESTPAGTVEAHFHALTAALQFTARYMPFSAVVTVIEQVRLLVQQLEESAIQGGNGNSIVSSHYKAQLAKQPLTFVEDQVSRFITWVVELLSPDAYIPCPAFVNLLLTTSSLSAERRRRLAEMVLKVRPITVPSVAQNAFELLRVLHDALPPTATPDEIAETEAIVTRVVAATFSPTAVPDQLLRFYSECRHVLNRFSSLRKTILYEALRLVVSAPPELIRKRRQQYRPCLAFVHATCPSVVSAMDRARVAADAACVAYERGFVAQGEALMETALTSLAEVPAVDSQAATAMAAGSVKFNDRPATQVAMQLVHVGVVMPPTASSDNHLFVVNAVLEWATEFRWNDAAQPSRLAATALSLLARAKAGSLLSSASNDVYKFSSLQRIALNKIPEYKSICTALQLKALRLLKANMPCAESSDGLEVAEILLGAFVAVPKDVTTHIALHWAVSPLLYGQYANAEQQYEAFRTSKNALLAALEAQPSKASTSSSASVIEHIKKGTGSAQLEAFEKNPEIVAAVAEAAALAKAAGVGAADEEEEAAAAAVPEQKSTSKKQQQQPASEAAAAAAEQAPVAAQDEVGEDEVADL